MDMLGVGKKKGGEYMNNTSTKMGSKHTQDSGSAPTGQQNRDNSSSTQDQSGSKGGQANLDRQDEIDTQEERSVSEE